MDYAATVEDAIALLEQYDMNSDINTMHHLAISDATGRSVVVEYIDNVMFVTETPVVTNFYLTQGDMYGVGGEVSKKRFDVLLNEYRRNEGILDEDSMRTVLEAVRSTNGYEPQWISQWSVVFNQTNGTATYYLHEDFNKKYDFKFN